MKRQGEMQEETNRDRERRVESREDKESQAEVQRDKERQKEIESIRCWKTQTKKKEIQADLWRNEYG